MSTPSLDELLSCMRPLTLPMRTTFRGISEREIVLFEAPLGLAEWSPFVEYDDLEGTTWLRCALEHGWGEHPVAQPELGTTIRVNGTLGAIDSAEVAGAISAQGTPRTIKVKVAGPTSTLVHDIERVREVRRVLGAEGRIRLDANGYWSLDEAEHAIRAMEQFDLEYVEQPVSDLSDLAELRRRVSSMGIQIAADESIRRWSDIDAVIQASACDIAVIKVQPLGGLTRSLKVIDKASRAGLSVVVSSALECSVGIQYAATLQHTLESAGHALDAGLGTVSFFSEDPTTQPLIASGGLLTLNTPVLDGKKMDALRMSAPRAQWWEECLRRCYAAL